METLKITRPTRSKKLTQGWNENRACVYANGQVVGVRNGACPINSIPFYQSIGLKGHNGLDIATWRGESVHHSGFYDGWLKTEKDYSGGIGVDVVSKRPLRFVKSLLPEYTYNVLKPYEMQGVQYLQSYVKLRYWHLKAPVGHDGKDVKYGQIIGLADNTGASSGDHLHFGFKLCDEKGNSLFPNNGYYGALDPTPFYRHDVFAKDSAEFLNIDPAPLSAQERKEMISQLTVMQNILLSLRETIHGL